MNKITITVFFLLIIVTITFASGDGGEPFSYLRQGIGAEPSGLGRAYTAGTGNVNSIFWNPAGISELPAKQLAINLSKPFSDLGDVSLNSIAFAADYKKENFKIGAMILYFNVDNIREATTNLNYYGSYLTGKTFSHNEIGVLLNISKKSNDNFGIGVNLKYFKQKIYNLSDDIFTADIGILYWKKKVKFGIKTANVIPSRITLLYNEEKMPFYIQAGVNVNIFNNFNLFTDIKFQRHKTMENYIGINYKLIKHLTIRSGYNTEIDDLNLGFSLNLKSYTISFSSSFHQELGMSHNLSVNLKI